MGDFGQALFAVQSWDLVFPFINSIRPTEKNYVLNASNICNKEVQKMRIGPCLYHIWQNQSVILLVVSR